jgi:oxalate decarboxylase/phosphoglucose isomerase-like protein (cupin superfamily)
MVRLALVVALLSSPVFAQDLAIVAPAVAKVVTDNPHVRIVEVVFTPGAKAGTHAPPAGYYHVTQSGSLTVTGADGKVSVWSPKVGESGWMEAEPPHSSENRGKTTLAFTLVEVKSAAKNAPPRQ